MGLSLNQALNTASMGLNASESSINVIGNNLANANTIGFKAGRADFADLFSRTYTYGSAPGAYNGGTNPMQIGLGVSLNGVTTNFNQGTTKDGMTKTDMAIQGNGFFVLRSDAASSATQYYSRNGAMKLNPLGELVNQDGLYVMGYAVNDKYQLQTNALSKITIALGEMKIAEATENIVLDGLLNATGTEAKQGTVLSSEKLTDLSSTSPGASSVNLGTVATPNVVYAGTSGTGTGGGGNIDAGSYEYRFVYVDAAGVESDYSLPISVTLEEGNGSITLENLPAAQDGYTTLRIYRANTPEDANDPGVFHQVADLDLSTNPTQYLDTFSSEQIAETGQVLDQERLNGKYTYYVTYFDAEGNESRPSYLSDELRVSGGQILLSDIPAVDAANNPDGWVGRNIYRSTASDPDSHYLVTSINNMDPEATFIDKTSDADLVDNAKLSMAGNGNVLVNENTKLVDIGEHLEDGRFVPLFETGTMEFTPNKGTADLKTQTLEVTENTTVAEYLKFLNESMGITNTSEIPSDQGEIGKTINEGRAGASVVDGQIVILGNAGTKNALQIDEASMRLKTDSGTKTVSLPFEEKQKAEGESISMSMEVYDSLGAPVNVTMTFVLEEKTNTETVYRWYAHSDDNQPLTGNSIGLGTGTITFDSDGRYLDSSNTQITVQRTDEASHSPMNFTFDMNLASVSALSTTKPEMTMKSQDGAGAGILIDYSIGKDGVVTGVFSSNVTRPIGQVLLATFINDEGLVSMGDNLYREGDASGAARIEVPGTGTAGSIKGNAVELSNTDIAQELVDMILASTMYQANSKIISTSNTMMDALLRVVG